MLQYFDEFYMTDDQALIRNKYHEIYELLKKAHIGQRSEVN